MRFALVILLLAACTHHRPLRHAYEVSGDVTIETFDGRILDATAMDTPTGTVFRTARGDVLEPGNVVRVTDTRRLRGAAEGLGIGAGAGVLIGVALGLASGSDPPCEECWFNMTAGEKAAFAGVGLGIVGAGIGLLSGAILGSNFVYDGRETPVITPVGPPGSTAGLTVHF
jgi:hypothetical protein